MAPEVHALPHVLFRWDTATRISQRVHTSDTPGPRKREPAPTLRAYVLSHEVQGPLGAAHPDREKESFPHAAGLPALRVKGEERAFPHATRERESLAPH